MLTAEAPVGVPGRDAVMARAGTENFPVASRLLPRRERADLLAIYGFARLVDELGDAAAGDRLAALDWLEAELDRAMDARAHLKELDRLFVRVFGEAGPAMLSRAVAGLHQGLVVFALPGSPSAVKLALEKLIVPELGHLRFEAHR